MARQPRAERTRMAIIRAAAQVFDRHGFAGAHLNDVVDRAAVTKGALYFHFQSKEELARAVIEKQRELVIGAAREAVQSTDLPELASVIRLWQIMARQLMGDCIVRAGARLSLETGSLVVAAVGPYEECVEATEVLLRKAARGGVLRTSVTPENLAALIVASFTGVQLISQLVSGYEDLSARLAQMWKVFLPGLVSPEELAYYLSVAAGTSNDDSITGASPPPLQSPRHRGGHPAW